MGEMRKDYVLEKFMIITPKNGKNSDQKKSPYAPGNESMTNPSVLSLVAKDGMLQRLQDSEDNFVKNCQLGFLRVKIQQYLLKLRIPIAINRIIANLPMDIITL